MFFFVIVPLLICIFLGLPKAKFPLPISCQFFTKSPSLKSGNFPVLVGASLLVFPSSLSTLKSFFQYKHYPRTAVACQWILLSSYLHSHTLPIKYSPLSTPNSLDTTFLPFNYPIPIPFYSWLYQPPRAPLSPFLCLICNCYPLLPC